MRILLDLQGCQTESRSRGIGRYSMALAQAIIRNADKHEVWVVLNNRFEDAIEHIRRDLDHLLPSERIVVFDVPASLSWDDSLNTWRRQAAELIRSSFLSELGPDIVHISSLFEGANRCDATASITMAGTGIPTVVTLYDLIPLLNPEAYLGSRWTHQWYMNKVESLKRADLLLSISEYSRQEAIDHLGVSGDHIVNISSAHADIFRPSAAEEAGEVVPLSRFGIALPYVMYNGAIESRKNLDRLLEAFALLPSELRARHQLVLVGRASSNDRDRLERLARSLGIYDELVLTGHVSDRDLVQLFTRCALFVFPSIHEGFGLPALEAMACGAPTIGSNVTSIPEVIGRPDALFDPFDPNDMAKKIADALVDERFRLSLREHAVLQASKFSWDACAKRAIAAFERLHRATSSSVKSWAEIAAARADSYVGLVNAIAKIPHHPVGPSDQDLAEIAKCIAENRIQTDRIARARELPERVTWRIEGPFDSSYSLALLNRETARALDALGHVVCLHSTEGPGDFPPNPDFLRANPDIASLYARSAEVSAMEADVTSRNLYPPRVGDMACRMNVLHHYAWEESGFPQRWAESFGEHLQGLTCLSSHVEKIMVDHGVPVPITVSGCGVDHWERVVPDQTYEIQAKSFRFIHVSSCFPRKGVDLLLDAYGRVFTNDDDVTLVIKTFPNPHNEIHKWLADARAHTENFPDVCLIEEDLSDAELKSLYRQCHVLVAPSKAEGFGLPMAEAMLSGLAVITTAWGGQLDFCNHQTAWLVDYTFEPAQTHFGLYDSVWARPNTEDLASTMHSVYEISPALRKARSDKGKMLLLERFRWSDVGKRLVSSARTFARMPPLPQPHIGWVSTWNTRCGIASYSAHLLEEFPSTVTILAAKTSQPTYVDGPDVSRCWAAGDEDTLDGLAACIAEHRINILVVQFQYSFFNLEALDLFLNQQLDAGQIVVLTMHSTSDPIHVLPHKRLEKLRGALARCHRILVHAPDDLNRLKALGLVDNVALFPHGVPNYTRSGAEPTHKSNSSFTLASYGFFLPHKGLLELIEAVALLRQLGVKVKLRMVNAEYPAPESAILIQKARDKIAALELSGQVELSTDFLSDEKSLSKLSDVDLIVFPYQVTGESSSAAVRYGLATGRPVAVTPLSIFDDVRPAVYELPGGTPKEIADGIDQILQQIASSTEKAQKKEAEAERWREAHLYSGLSQRLYGMLQALARQQHSAVN